jgi:hypothetical protein
MTIEQRKQLLNLVDHYAESMGVWQLAKHCNAHPDYIQEMDYDMQLNRSKIYTMILEHVVIDA